MSRSWWRPAEITKAPRSRTLALASNTAASAALVDGRSTAAGIVRVARSIIQVSSTRSASPLSSTTRTFNGVESICIHSPGRTAVTVPNGRSGRLANDWRVRAEPVVCLPADNAANNR